MTRDEASAQRVAYSRVDRDTGTNVPPKAKNAKQGKGPNGVSGTNVPSAPSMWLRNVNDYDRCQPREYAVTRFG
jgi:hypothetical protein